MGHLAIYRKYRPSNFDEVSGQKTVTSILKNAIKNNNVSHAYLFTGPRGTGKTSIAKIFARTINCEEPNEGNPCNKCSSCYNSLSKECVDIIEIDAASNNGVDEIRELKSKINIVPSHLKYKVYIIDEVHMLSIGAFNALLKTLEEPPSHVIFILATTEIQKVPITILSRCQTLEFKKLSLNDMKKRIEYVCNCENIEIEECAIEEITNISDGCMRDALSFLEKINAFCNGKISNEDVRTVSGKPPKQMIEKLIELFIENEIQKVISKIQEMYLNDFDLLYVVEDIINKLDEIIFETNLTDVRYQKLLTKMIEIYDKMKNSSVNNKIIFEIGMLEHYNTTKNISREIFLKPKDQNETIINKKKQYDVEDTKEEKKEFVEITTNNINESEFKKIRINNTFVNANKQKLNNIKQQWDTFKEYAFDKENGARICSLLDATPVAASGEYLILSYQYKNETSKINNDYQMLEKIIKEYLSISCKIVAVSDEEWIKLRQEYVNKINTQEKYELLEDNFDNNKLLDKTETNKENINYDSNNNIENKIFELFDSKYIEIK